MNRLKKFTSMIVMLLKFSLFFIVFAIFFLLFGINNAWLLHLSRTAVVTSFTFVLIGLMSMSIFGGYNIGMYKSKPIISSLSLAMFFTDAVTYLLLCIMNTNSANNDTFKLEDLDILLIVYVLQFIMIVAFTYFGNHLYFAINEPEKCCVITTSRSSLNNVVPKIMKYEKQYNITDMILFTSPDLFDIIDRSDTVFVYDVPIPSRTAIVEYCYANNKNIYYNFEMCDVVALRGRTALLDDKPLYASQLKGLSIEQKFFKRALDLFGSVIGLIVLSPLFLICAVCIKLEDGGKVFFKQKRATIGGKIFNVYKFRTMKEQNAVNRSVTSDDDRITKVGNVLRKFRIDELPQLINILKGEMSIVGPRPEMIENVEQYTDTLTEFNYRLRVKAGLTGHAQIAGKYNTSPKDKLVLDLMYIEKYSLWLDIKLILQTLTVFFKAGESTEAFGKGEEYEFFTQPKENSDKEN